MPDSPDLQSTFLEQVRLKMDSRLSFVDELAELLNVSRDSAYRRIRGETILSLKEAQLLSVRYGVSLDKLIFRSSDAVSFQLHALNNPGFTFEMWLKSMLTFIDMVRSEASGELIWHAKDLPIFHYFQYPSLAAFKMHFWIKSFTKHVKYDSGSYNPALVPKEMLALAEKIWTHYAEIDSREIINHEILNVTLRQIEFAHDCGMFKHPEEGKQICDDCLLLIRNLAEQAAKGRKGKGPGKENYWLYLDDILIGDNTVLFKMGGKSMTLITHNNFNLLTTSNEHFCDLTENHMKMMFSKSVLISFTSERERSKFFKKIEEQITELKSRM